MITLDGFKAWLATKDPNELVRYSSNTNCVVAQYYKQALGKPNVWVGIDTAYPNGLSGASESIPEEIAEALYYMMGDEVTFGYVQNEFGISAADALLARHTEVH